ncbi:hypothetical protein FSP39_005965 [Pinctada imbricata]|uniref:Uncharacterized protein n=1 Tax=Pinctada imbricata TaxID=66713 RepID=A0AA88XL74_PINIB|nr:hypothetical protein FSP39_005965 [Pinctada imbricata]
MWDLSSPWTALDWGPLRKTKETTCGPLCQHPPCWAARNREIKGIETRTPPAPPQEEIETDLPTVKICNMLEEYGDDPSDRFPTKYDGKPKHSRKASVASRKVNNSRNSGNSGLKVPSPPVQTPTSEQTKSNSAPPKRSIQLVEVQEMFDVDDLNNTWDDTFLPKKYYVWVPNNKKKKKRLKKEARPDKILMKDLTEDMIPREFELDQAPRDELLELPREILVQVLDHAKQSDFQSSQKLHELIQRFVPEGIERENTNLTATSADLLQQKKMNIYEGKERKLRESHLLETKPVYYLDEDGVEQEVLPDEETEGLKDRRLIDSDYGSLRDLYGLSGTREFPRLKKPLPPIQGEQPPPKLPSISLGLPELPSGVKHTKAFTYTRRNYRNYDFTLGPVPTPPTSARTSEAGGSDHGTTIHVNIPSANSQEPIRQATQPADGKKQKPMSAHSERSGGRHTPLHAVSPSQSTKVPHAPATTPATHGHGLGSPMKSMHREVSSSSAQNHHGNKDGSVSPTQDIRAPMNSPRMMSPEATGLDTIQEHGQEDGGLPVSRGGGRSVRFAEEVPEVPPPPSSPQPLGEEATDPNALKIPVAERDPSSMPLSRETGLTNQPTFHTGDKDLSEDELLRSAKRREPSMASTPEPWPQVNEADFDITPANTKLTLHESRAATNGAKPDDSRLANHDTTSERTVGTGSSTMRSSDINSRDSTRSYLTRKEESPGPPPPSPESKDKNSEEARSARKRESKSRESNTTMPLIEENEEEVETSDSHVRTLVVEVPPLGQLKDEKTQTKAPIRRTVDTFVNIDIPAQTQEELAQEAMSVKAAQGAKGNGRRLVIESTVEEEDEDVTTQDEGTTLNTREQNLSVQSSSVDGPSTIPESEVESAGVDPSVGGNVSPSSTITDAKVNNQDLRNFIEQQQGEIQEEENDPPSTRREDHVIEGREADEDTRAKADKAGEVADKDETQNAREDKTQIETEDKTEERREENVNVMSKEKEITEDGGDHEGFKQELREEYERMSREEAVGQEEEKTTEDKS